MDGVSTSALSGHFCFRNRTALGLLVTFQGARGSVHIGVYRVLPAERCGLVSRRTPVPAAGLPGGRCPRGSCCPWDAALATVPGGVTFKS